jgi:hypothetical protein
MPCISHQANVPLGSLSSSSASIHMCCLTDQSRSLPVAVQSQLLPPAPPTASLFAPIHDAAGTTVPAQTPLVLPVDRNDNGGTLPPSTSEITTLLSFGKRLDPQTPVFRSNEDKEEFIKLLPSAVPLRLNQPFGKKDQLNQSFYVQKSGQQVLFVLFESRFMSNRVKKKLERSFPPARYYLSQLLKKYAMVDFRWIQGFEPNWELQTSISIVQRDRTMACLIAHRLSLPAVVRWIGGPHVGAHRDLSTILPMAKKEACDEQSYTDLVRIFTQGAPTYINAECSQAYYRAYRDYGNHKSFDDTTGIVTTKTLLKDAKRGCTLMLDPLVLDFLENTKTTPHGIVDIDHPYKNPRTVCDASARPFYWCHAINDWTDKANEPTLTFADAFVQTLVSIWNLCITYPLLEIYLCDEDISNACRQVKYPPDLAGLHCKVVNNVLYVDTGQNFGGTTSGGNFEPIPVCRSQLAKWLWHHFGAVAKTRPLLQPIQHQEPPTRAEVSQFVQANRDS